MRQLLTFFLFANSLRLSVHGFERKRENEHQPTIVKEGRIYEANINLNYKRKRKANVKPPASVKLPSKNSTALDYGDYEDYDLSTTTTSSSQSPSTVPLIENEESLIFESHPPHHDEWSQKSHQYEKSKSALEVLDELSRLMGDTNHRDELSQRTTVTRANMTTPMPPKSKNNEMEKFFNDEEVEGSGDAASADVIAESIMQDLQKTTMKPPIYTTVVQEIDSLLPSTSPYPSKNKEIKKGYKKYRKSTLHGGAVSGNQFLGKPKSLHIPTQATPIIPTRAGKRNSKNLRKISKVDKQNRIRKINNKINAYKKMKIRKVFTRKPSKLAKPTRRNFVGSTSQVTASPIPIPRNPRKLFDTIITASTTTTTMASTITNTNPLPFGPIDHESESFHARTRSIRQKRDANEPIFDAVGDNGIFVFPSETKELAEIVPILTEAQFLEKERLKSEGKEHFNAAEKKEDVITVPEVIAAGGAWDTSPIEISVLTSMKEQQPYVYLKGPTQVEPSKLITEQSNDDFVYFQYEPKSFSSKKSLTQVTLEGIATNLNNHKRSSLKHKSLRMVGMNSVKKIGKKRNQKFDLEVIETQPIAKRPRAMNKLNKKPKMNYTGWN